MKPPNVEGVQLGRRVMHRVEPPHQRVAMEGPVEPVPHEIGRQQHHGDLRHNGDVVGPEDIDGQPACLKCSGKPDDHGDCQQIGQGRLHHNDEERVGTNLLCGGPPVSAVGQHHLVQCDEAHANQRRAVGG